MGIVYIPSCFSHFFLCSFVHFSCINVLYFFSSCFSSQLHVLLHHAMKMYILDHAFSLIKEKSVLPLHMFEIQKIARGLSNPLTVNGFRRKIRAEDSENSQYSSNTSSCLILFIELISFLNTSLRILPKNSGSVKMMSLITCIHSYYTQTSL